MLTPDREYYFSVDNLCKDVFLRKHMDSKGFVFLDLIAGFARIKKLTTDMELIKWACYNSKAIDFRVGHDGKDRLRRREGWEQWVLGMAERDASAQNDGPEELHHPPVPHPTEIDHSGLPYHGVPLGSPTGPAFYPQVNGVQSTSGPESIMGVSENVANGQATNGVNGFGGSDEHLETSTKAVSGEPDSFSDAQVETLSVIVRKQELPQVPTSLPSATRTLSNGSINSKSAVADDSLKMNGRQPVNGTSPGQG
jgi:la-related protein 1